MIPENEIALPSMLSIRFDGGKMDVVTCRYSSTGTASCGDALDGLIRQDGTFSVRSSWEYWQGALDRQAGSGWAKVCGKTGLRDCTIEEFDRSRFLLARRDPRGKSPFDRTLYLEFPDGTAGALAISDENGVLHGEYWVGCVGGPVCGFGLQEGEFALNTAFRTIVAGKWDAQSGSGAGILRSLSESMVAGERVPFEIRSIAPTGEGSFSGRFAGLWEVVAEGSNTVWYAGENGGWLFVAGRGYRDVVFTLDGTRLETSKLSLMDYCAHYCADAGDRYELELTADGREAAGTVWSNSIAGARASPVVWKRH